MARGLDLLAGVTGDVLKNAYQERKNQMYYKLGILRQEQQQRFQEQLQHSKELFEASENQKKLDAQRKVAEYREEQATGREKMGIEAGKYDKSGRWSYWSSLKLDPKYKAALGVAESNIGEASDILSSSSAMWMTPEQKKPITEAINLYRGLQDEVLQQLIPGAWKRAKEKYLPKEMPAPKGKPENDPFAEFGGEKKK